MFYNLVKVAQWDLEVSNKKITKNIIKRNSNSSTRKIKLQKRGGQKTLNSGGPLLESRRPTQPLRQRGLCSDTLTPLNPSCARRRRGLRPPPHHTASESRAPPLPWPPPATAAAATSDAYSPYPRRASASSRRLDAPTARSARPSASAPATCPRRRSPSTSPRAP